MRSLLRPLLILVLLTLAVYIFQKPWFVTFSNPLAPWPTKYTVSKQSLRNLEKVLVTKVYDGDTIEITGGRKVRFLSIDTPETHHPRKLVECYGYAASERTRQLLEDKVVFLKKDVDDVDSYKRLLRYIYLPKQDDPNELLFVNAYLVGEGFAHELTISPNLAYLNYIHSLAKKAESEKRGLWGSCKPDDFAP